MSASEDLLTDLLKSVSRAFYLSLWVLPSACRIPLATGYLLARSADTIADTEQLTPASRGQALRHFRELVADPRGPGWPELAGMLPSLDRRDPSAERRLLARLPDSLKLLETLAPDDRAAVQAIVETLASGMEADLAHFPAGQISALERPQDLDRHTYLAAGCVGEFWTDILLRHVESLGHWDPLAMKALGVRFGKALQLTNVLRDLPGDLREGRCYLPLSQLREVGLQPADLARPQNWGKLRPVYQQWLRLAVEHYACALRYILALPRWELKLRLSVIWPVLIGLATLDKLAAANPLEGPRLKVSRGWVYRTLILSVPAAPFDGLVSRWVEGWFKSILHRLTPSRAEL